MSTPTAQVMRHAERYTDWRAKAACRDCDPELFFPTDDIQPIRTQVKAAKEVCRRCPVVLTCLTWALDSDQEAGIWGGTTEQERRILRRRRDMPP
jgi:WhiB family transcriptional regulator, redox-sensing transcriptional regulator